MKNITELRNMAELKNITELKNRLNELHEKIENGDTTQETSVEAGAITNIIELLKLELQYADLRSKGDIEKIAFFEKSPENGS